MVQFLPWWLALLVPGPWSLRISMVALGYLLGLYFSLSFMEDACERRLVKAGYPAGLNRKIREETPVSARAESAAFYAPFYPPQDRWPSNADNAATGRARTRPSAFLESRTAAASFVNATSTQLSLPPPVPPLKLLLRQRKLSTVDTPSVRPQFVGHLLDQRY